MADEDKPYSDPSDQRSLADALSQTAGPYSPENLVSALRKKDQPPDVQPAADTVVQPKWALDAKNEVSGMTRSQLMNSTHYSSQQKRVLQQYAQPDAPPPVWSGPMTGQQQIMADAKAGKISYQQELAALHNPNAYQSPVPPTPPTPQQNLAGIQLSPQQPTAPAGPPGAAEAQPPALPRPAPAQTIGEHWVNTMDPADRAAMAAAQGQQLAGVGGQAEAEAKAADEMARVAYHGHEDQRVQQLLDRQALDPERVKLDQHAQQLQDQAERLSRQKVDPEHYMASRSAGQKVMMAIASALSGFSAGLKGGPNQAMEHIKAAIDDDNRAQMQNIENARAGNEQQKGILADKMKLFGNKEQALAAARQEQLQGVAAQIDDIARQYQSPEIMAKATQLNGQLAEHFAAEGASVQKYVPAQTVGGGPSEAAVHQLAAKWISEGRYGNPDEATAAARQTLSSQAGPANLQATSKGAPAGSTIDLAEVEKAGRAAVGTKGMAAFVGEHVPAWAAPKAAAEAQTLNHYNNVIIPGVMKNLESRMSPEQIAAAKKELGIKPSDPPAIREQKLQQLLQFGRVGAGVKGKAVTGGEGGPPPADEPLPGEAPP